MSPLAKSKSRGPDLAIILGGHKPPMDDEEGEDKGGDDHKGALKDAIEAFFRAGEEGDFAAASEAYETMHDLCAAKAEDEDDEDDEEEEY